MGRVQLSVEVGKPESDHESAPRRSYRAVKAAWTTPAGKPHVTTIYELYKDGIRSYGKHNALGQRKLLKLHEEEREVTKLVDGEEKKVMKRWQYFEMGPYNFITYNELDKVIDKVAAGLVNIGVRPGKDRFQIFAKTSPEWLEVALACASQTIPIVTAYDSLGVEGLMTSINEAETVGVFVDPNNLSTLASTLSRCPSIKSVIYRDYDDHLGDIQDSIKTIESLNGGIRVYRFSEILKLGEDNPVEPNPPKPEDCACIMYTSGSTGPPKGVIINHCTVIGGVAGASGIITCQTLSPSDVMLSVLPLAHILEYTAELLIFIWGVSLGYGHPRTLADTNMRNCKGDIRELRPTAMAAVPAVFEAVKKGIFAKVRAMPLMSRLIFSLAYQIKSRAVEYGLPSPLLDRFVFRKIKEATGGRMRYVMSGGASLSRDTRIFLKTLIGPCLMGYGLTETNAMAALMSPKYIDLDSTGQIVPSVTVKLVDVPDAGYFGQKGQGEIWIKGVSVSPGYFKNEEETKRAYQDGWFKTGDVGEWTENGSIRVIDRLKNLVKTANGEFIALERLESLYRSNAYVGNICVFANDLHYYPVGVIVPIESAVKQLCKEIGIEYTDTSIHNPVVIKKILESLHKTGRECGMRSNELLGAIALADEEWTPQNGLISSAQKIQRRAIRKKYENEIDQAFERGG